MNEIINITTATINNEEVNAVNARDLWKFLESQQEFANWIKNRIKEYGFEEGKDFLIILSKSHGRPRKDYAITLDMAKELAMVENNEQGKKARRYFIEVEKQYREWSRAAEAYRPEPETPEFDDGDPDLFIEKAYYMEQRVLPTWILANRLGISSELLRILSASASAGLIEGADIFRLRNVGDRFLQSMKKVGFLVRDEFRNINLYTPSGADKIVEVLKRTGLVEREQLIRNHMD